MRIYVFPGQGSQAKGMGGELFDEFPELTQKADEILGYSIKELCLNDPERQLGMTQYTQPAIYTVNAISCYKKMKESGSKPDGAAGHSLGEYNALLTAECFDFETGLRLVKKRGELMGQVTGGAMCAVLGLSDKDVQSILVENELTDISIANHNTPTQVVLSGLKFDILKAEPYFQREGVKYIPLNTSGAFHSKYMQSVKDEFKDYLEKFKFSALALPVISNVTARPYKGEDIIANLSVQVIHSVKWIESIRYLMAHRDVLFEEIGHGEVLTKLISQIRSDTSPLTVREDEKIKKRKTSTINTAGKNEKGIQNEQQTNVIATPLVTISSLGNEEYKKDYNLKYAYVAGGMYRGIASEELVVKMAKAGMMSYFGAGGLGLDRVEKAIKGIQRELNDGQAYGVNLINSRLENETVDLLLKHGVQNVEAAAYMQITAALVKYRLQGLHIDCDGEIVATNRIMAKISRPEVAEQFLSPAPEKLVEKLLAEKIVTPEQAALSAKIPMADDLCVEADSGGHTDQGVAYALMPAMLELRDKMLKKYQYGKNIRVGAAGGIGTPQAASAAFILGADFILTGSINQCTVEAGTSDVVKDLLQDINVQDTGIAPSSDMFEFGAKVQVLSKSVFFPARANKLYELYRNYNSLDEIDEKTRKQLEERYFRRSFEEIFQELKLTYSPTKIEQAESNPKQKMALVFKWYLRNATKLALKGVEEQKVDFQVHCGPALGAFNQWVKSTDLHNWRNRHVDEIAIKLMEETADLLNKRFQSFGAGRQLSFV